MPFALRHRPERRFRISYALLALAGALTLGTVGFHLVEGWSLTDSLYVTVQTLTTVGYGDIPPHSNRGRIFATVIMMVGAGGVALAVSTIVQSVVKWELASALDRRRMARRMSKVSNHYIICGSGRVGTQVIKDLLAGDETCVVVENEQQRAASFAEMGLTVQVGDATLEQTLLDVGVERAKGLAACLPNDADNVYVVLTARDINPKLRIVARAVDTQGEAKLIRAGANHVVAPTMIGGHRLALALTKPVVSEFVDAFTESQLALRFEECEVVAGSPLAGQELSSIVKREDVDVVIMSVRHPDGNIVFNPPGETKITSGDILISIGRVEALLALTRLASGEP
ncbi:MAG TPA: potassium channel protein [Pyrinomonadaceae bacterium]|nr:potassium channel protein [Pyrinomonadaceae bacterium]